MGAAVIGKCHLCKDTKQVCLCDQCGHWFCGPCWTDWMGRGIAALKSFVGGPTPNCCGPEHGTG